VNYMCRLWLKEHATGNAFYRIFMVIDEIYLQ